MATPTPAPSSRLFLFDGTALAYRSHFAFAQRPLTTARGEVVSAIYAFVMTLWKILDEERPSHVVVVFDAKGPTFRHELYSDYKATRPPTPPDLVMQLPGIRAVVEAFRIPVIEQAGIEADDVIGTLATRAAEQGVTVRIVSGDKDFCQLIDDRIQMYTLGRTNDQVEVLDPDQVVRKFGVAPEQIIDFLSLVGDASDNVPGVARIGEKTAADLLQQFGSLDSLYANLAQVAKNGVRRALEEGRESAYLSRRLVTIDRGYDLPIALESMQRQPADQATLRDLFQRYQFKSLLQRLDKTLAADSASDPSSRASARSSADPPELTSASPSAHPSADLPTHSTGPARQYELVDDADKLRRWIARLRKAGFFVLDTETTDLDPLRAELVGISFSCAPGEAGFVPVHFRQNLFEPAVRPDLGSAQQEFFDLLRDPAVGKAGQNIKYDLHVLHGHGVEVDGVCFDTMIAHYCVEPSALSHGLDALSEEYFSHRKIKTTELIGTGKNRKTMAEVPVAQVCEYACEDADYAFRLVEPLRAKMREREVIELFEKIEIPLLHVLLRMERAGVAIDLKALNEMGEKMLVAEQGLVRNLHVLAGEPFNVQSTRQLGQILYEKLKVHEQLGISRIPKTKTGWSTSYEALEPMVEHPLVAKILEYREINKLRSTYVEALPRLIHPRTGRIHTSYNQAVAATGRLSSSDPNLQNIPIRSALGREIRRAFKAGDPKGSLISADYSQIELRILAHLAQDEALSQAFSHNEDIHRSTAARIFGVDPQAVTSELRSRAKTINFGIIYGMGAQRLARETGITMREAQAFIERYFQVFQGVKRYLDKTFEDARVKGYVTTLSGRRRYIPELQSADRRMAANARNMAVNTPIQGTAADLIKIAMLRIDEEMRKAGLRSQMVLQVHDELVFDVVPGESTQVRDIARSCMENAIEMSVPLKVEIGEGPTWLDAH